MKPKQTNESMKTKSNPDSRVLSSSPTNRHANEGGRSRHRRWVILLVFGLCFWMGNILVTLPTVAELLAAKAWPMLTGGFEQGFGGAMVGPPSWLTWGIAVLISTQMLALVYAVQAMAGVTAGKDETDLATTAPSGTERKTSNPVLAAVLLLAFLALFYTVIFVINYHSA